MQNPEVQILSEAPPAGRQGRISMYGDVTRDSSQSLRSFRMTMFYILKMAIFEGLIMPYLNLKG